ncbi:MAG: hypothetical protein ABR949_14900 [Candidatus Aquilonibacter sp.]|jgi:hypothetical protein
MSWFKGKGLPKPEKAAPPAKPQRKAHEAHPPREIQERIVHFLVTHQRVELRAGHPLMHFLGMTHNHVDGSVDYSVRSHVKGIDGKNHRFDSHIRIYASGHLKLIR